METTPSKGIIMEIRAGAGGEESALFAMDLYKMYQKFAQAQGWQINLLESHKTSLGGLKKIVFEVNGPEVYSSLKYESGVHRVQRIPKTEKSGRIHTSTVSLAVLPKVEELQIKINPSDLKFDISRASGPGGQHVNKVETAVRLTHLPTGLTVECQSERSQARNREKALDILRAKLYHLKQEEQETKIAQERKEQIGWAMRAEKIRTYNFPQNRITDHRIKKTWHNLENILNGHLEPVIKNLRMKL